MGTTGDQTLLKSRILSCTETGRDCRPFLLSQDDVDTPVTITGADFTAVMDGTGTVVVTSPTASLAGTALTNATWVHRTTLTAKVPWGLDPGVYTLTVVNRPATPETRLQASIAKRVSKSRA
jgi:hypothetical protein